MKITKYVMGILIFVIFLFIILYENKSAISSIVYIESINENEIRKGMGFVYKIENNSYYIVTNYHIIDKNDKVIVYNMNQEKVYASIENYDSYSDIAILKTEDKLNLKEATLGANKYKKNNKIYYYNIEKKDIDEGVIFDLYNEITISNDYGNSFYNVTAITGNIIEGNSGGPIFNKEKHVIGLLSLKEESTSKAFYMPIDYVMDIVTKLENHKLIRPNIGAVMCDVNNKEILHQYSVSVENIDGVVVLDVIENYPLDLANIIKGDVITKVNDVVIKNITDLQRQIYSYNIGDIITLEYYRNNSYNTIDIVLDK